MSSEEWTVEKIQEMIETGREESLKLEYKTVAALSQNAEIAKDISAFANAVGGTIIYGVVEKGNKPSGFDEGIDSSKKLKETIEHIITDLIQPKLNGVLIYPLDRENGNQIFVIDIPQSIHAPHMAGNRYYRRHNFKVQAMEHYEVVDMMNRQTGPDLWLESEMWKNDEKISTQNLSFSLKMALINNSKTAAYNAIITLSVDEQLQAQARRGIKDTSFLLPSDEKIHSNDSVFYFSGSTTPIFGNHTFGFCVTEDPQFKKLEFVFVRSKLKTRKIENLEAYIYWKIESPNMSTRHGVEKITTGHGADWDGNEFVKVENLYKDIL